MKVVLAFTLGIVLGHFAGLYAQNWDQPAYQLGEFQQQLYQFQQQQNILQGRNPVTGYPLRPQEPC